MVQKSTPVHIPRNKNPGVGIHPWMKVVIVSGLLCISYLVLEPWGVYMRNVEKARRDGDKDFGPTQLQVLRRPSQRNRL